MVKNSSLNFKSKKRKKSKEQDSFAFDEIKNYFISYKSKFKNKYKNFLNILKKHENKIKEIKKFFLIITGYGLVINYSIHFIFGIKFNLFTLFAWGIAYYFISDEFVEWFRRLIAKI